MPKSQFDYFIISSKHQIVKYGFYNLSDNNTVDCLMTEMFVLPGFFVVVTGVYSFLQLLLCKVDTGAPYF